MVEKAHTWQLCYNSVLPYPLYLLRDFLAKHWILQTSQAPYLLGMVHSDFWLFHYEYIAIKAPVLKA